MEMSKLVASGNWRPFVDAAVACGPMVEHGDNATALCSQPESQV